MTKRQWKQSLPNKHNRSINKEFIVLHELYFPGKDVVNVLENSATKKSQVQRLKSLTLVLVFVPEVVTLLMRTEYMHEYAFLDLISKCQV